MDGGKIWIADDFDTPDPPLEALFYRPITAEPSEGTPTPAKRKKKT
jgi:hypothetical protein